MRANLTIQLVERVPDLLQDVVTTSRQSIDAGRLGSLRFLSAQPPALRHS
jgi:hypothetical protein